MAKINPYDDGVTHINIYSQGRTALGRMLSNFYKFPISTKDGNFMSVEGYWYWLGIEDCSEKEALRNAYGYDAKRLGRALKLQKHSAFDNNFEEKIKLAIWYKFKRNASLVTDELLELPFEHYYNYNGRIKDVKNNYPWMLEAIDKMRWYIVENIFKEGE